MGRKWGVIAHSGVGKSALLEELRRDPRLAGKCIVELDSALPAWFDGVKADSFDKATSGDYWLWAKMSATHSALKQKADIIAGLYREGQLRRLLEASGFSLVVLSLPAEVHRERLQKRLREEGYIPKDVERCIRAQKGLEGLGYELIDADRPVEEIAADVAERMLQPEASSPRQPAL